MLRRGRRDSPLWVRIPRSTKNPLLRPPAVWGIGNGYGFFGTIFKFLGKPSYCHLNKRGKMKVMNAVHAA
ncbi:MAG: hypothetical protein G01um101431_938 [Parcubacteria group bacterium Gr01-1014_31]|nr:MAG: hypothetical protein G01um101431_938 [Parcubacteria group bacterium Gr01-1014_31]